jgi:hypothetical protein
MEQKDFSGVLFQNKNKKEDRHPDYTGKSVVDGIEYSISGCKKTTKNGDPMLSLSFKIVQAVKNE